MLRHKTNPHLVRTVLRLKKASWEREAPIWRAVAKQLEKPARVWPAVNVGQIARVAEDDKVQLVPGKVLGGGFVDRELTVVAWSFSASARDKIEAAGGTCRSLDQALTDETEASSLQVVA